VLATCSGVSGVVKVFVFTSLFVTDDSRHCGRSCNRGARLRNGRLGKAFAHRGRLSDEDVERTRAAISTGFVDLSSAEEAVAQMTGGKGQRTFDQLPESGC